MLTNLEVTWEKDEKDYEWRILNDSELVKKKCFLIHLGLLKLGSLKYKQIQLTVVIQLSEDQITVEKLKR
jgi:hypothetical protein